MNLQEIQAAVDSGKKVHWANTGYTVIKDNVGQYLIVYAHNDYCIGLTWRNGSTLNGKPEEFFIGSDS